jgi:heme A synthase
MSLSWSGSAHTTFPETAAPSAVSVPPPLPGSAVRPLPAWLRFWAAFTAFAALPLVTLGAEVTTKRVGMVDRVGFRAPWHLFTLSPDERTLGILIEHGHRLAGFVVGMACIVLAGGMLVQGRGWRRSLGVIALAAVVGQGLLGIFRVNLNVILGPSLAMVHGCTAQLVFATLVGVAVLSARAWSAPGPVASAGSGRAAVLLCCVVYTQVVFGAVMRHLLDPLAQRLHILLAFAVVLGVFQLLRRLWREGVDSRTRLLACVLAGLVLVQPVLGVEAWVRRFGSGGLPDDLPYSVVLNVVRSTHHVLGTLIFAATVALALMANRRPEPVRAGRLETA